MKKLIILFAIMGLLATMIVIATPHTVDGATPQTYLRKVRDRYGRVRYVRVRKPSYYRRHRNRINLGIGTAGGAIIGGLIGGRKGALIGAGTGLAGSTMYTYVWNKKKRRYVKVRRY